MLLETRDGVRRWVVQLSTTSYEYGIDIFHHEKCAYYVFIISSQTTVRLDLKLDGKALWCHADNLCVGLTLSLSKHECMRTNGVGGSASCPGKSTVESKCTRTWVVKVAYGNQDDAANRTGPQQRTGLARGWTEIDYSDFHGLCASIFVVILCVVLCSGA